MPIRILVVDDEPDVEALMRQKFRRQVREGLYEFHFAHDGEDALERIKQIPDLDIVVTDINMPRMDGLTLLEKIKESGQRLNAVVVSAYGDMGNIRTAMNRGAFDFLTKPIDFSDFEITLAKTWDQSQRAKQAARNQEQLTSIIQELKVASIIQKAILPSQFPAFPGRDEFDIYARNIPAKEVSGDFYDFFLVGESRLCFLIGDVSGKGVPSALFMAICRTLLRSAAEESHNAAAVLENVNRRLCLEDYSSMFTTLTFGILETGTGVVELCSAGHELPYADLQGGEFQPLPLPPNLALGVEPEFQYRNYAVTLRAGETILLYTDGVTEAHNSKRALFQPSRLEELLESQRNRTPRELIDAVFVALEAFTGDTPISDDITALAIRYLGSPAQ